MFLCHDWHGFATTVAPSRPADAFRKIFASLT